MRTKQSPGTRVVHICSAAALVLSLAGASPLRAQTYPSTTDPRVGLKVGRMDAGEAASNMRLVSLTPKPPQFDSVSGLNFANSDLAFRGDYVYAGNFAGFAIWNVSNPAKPTLASIYQCVTGQGDPSIYGNLLFVSAEGSANRSDCRRVPAQQTDPKDRMAGVRIFDVSNPNSPRLVKNVQTCKGSHTHTLIPHKTDRNIVYIYVSGGGGARPATEMDGCVNGTDPNDTTNSMYRLDVIRVPLNNPSAAEVVTGARIFMNWVAPERGVRIGGAGARGAAPPAGGRGADTTTASRGAGAPPTAPAPGRGGGGGAPRNCHDVTAYPEMNLLAGACGSGMIVDISNPEKPIRLDAKGDANFSLWHTAVFSNDGSKVVFTDEWGGGTGAMCQATSPIELGGNTILSIGPDKKLTQHAYFKINAAQTAQENCVSHNGGLVPVPGRDLMVQGWYQGGVNVFDFTNPDKPFEIAYFDRGPIPPPPVDSVALAARAAAAAAAAASGDTTAGRAGRAGRGGGRGGGGQGPTTGGSWGAYWYNGYIYSNEINRGFDVLELLPSEHLSANEIAAAKLVRYEQYNPQSQPKIVWPAAFPVVRSYLDQLVRNNGLPATRTTAIASQLSAAEGMTGAARRTALTTLATALDADAPRAADAARVRMMSAAVKDLAAASR